MEAAKLKRVVPSVGSRMRISMQRSACRVPSLLTALAVILTASPSLGADGAHPALGPPGSPIRAAGKTSHGARLNTVIVEAARAIRKVYRQVSRFVSSVTVGYTHDSLPRWNEPICPLVAGLPRAEGEFILARITQLAAAVHAPLAGRHCRANLYVVVTSQPDLMLQKWWARDRLMYDECNGLGGIEKYLHSKRPVRIWYNTVAESPGGSRNAQADLDAPAIGLHLGPVSTCITAGDGRQGLSQVIIVVDMRQIDGLDIGQLAAYVSMVGLAQIQLDVPPSGPSILTLFENRPHAMQGLSAWDLALLYALYHTPQNIGRNGLLQVSRIRNSMVSRILSSRSGVRPRPK